MQVISRFFCYSWLVCLIVFCFVLFCFLFCFKVIGNPISDVIVFKTELTRLTLRKRVEKSQAILTLLDGFYLDW